jgi:GH25 family lysozyme M1 (1,4-beta-N-acetylmuramidase)
MFYIDVSHYDWARYGGNLNWSQIKADGIDVVFIRASYGDPQIYSPETRYFKEMALEAKKAGLKVGGYHNLIHGDFSSIQRQITYFKGELDSVGADYAMIDVEPYEALKKNDLWPRLSDAELFTQEFSHVDARKVAVYLPQWVWSNWLNRADLRPLMDFAKGPLISSNYPLGSNNGDYQQLYAEIDSNPKYSGLGWIPYGNVIPEVWQYSSNANVPGASSTTDVNTYEGTSEEFDIRMAWVLTKNLQAFLDQMNYYFPNRDKSSDGTIGDYAHSQEHSGHNPDDTSQHNAEWDSDSDTKSEVRAIDIDSNTNDPDVSMEDILQHLLALAKSDNNFPIRYMIYNRRIYRNSNNWAKETYTGASAHTEHIHLSGEYSNTADENYYNYRLDELVALTQSDKDYIASFFKQGTQADGTPTSPVGNATLNQGIPNPVDGGKTYAWRVIQRIGDVAVANSKALVALSSKVDLEPSEIAALKAALDVPTAEENAQAVVNALGSVDIGTLADTLKNSLSTEEIAALKAAL